jgi:hypothetical protein
MIRRLYYYYYVKQYKELHKEHVQEIAVKDKFNKVLEELLDNTVRIQPVIIRKRKNKPSKKKRRYNK